jgi:hypothetical protein
LERGTAFRKTSRSDLDWIFSIQTERVVARDNTIAFRDQIWQLEKTRWRYSLAGCTVTVHEHLDGPMSLRYGPHLVASFDPRGNAISNRRAAATVIPDSACGSKEVNSPFPFPLRGKPGRAGSPHAASTLRASKKTLARIDASGSPHKRAAAPL